MQTISINTIFQFLLFVRRYYKKILIIRSGAVLDKLITKELIEKGFFTIGTMRDLQNRNKQSKEELEKLGAKIIKMDVSNTEQNPKKCSSGKR